jgi:hypothetical protein
MPPLVPVVVRLIVPDPVIGDPETPKILPPGTPKATEVTVPPPAGVAHVPSPLQKVEAEADVPLLRLVTGKLPETSAVRSTALNVGAPTPLPCKRVVVVPREPSVAGAAPAPPPNTMRFANRLADDAIVVVPEKYGMPPEVPEEIPVPPCATVTAAFVVRTVAEASGKAKVFSVAVGPDTAKNPLPVPPFAPGKIPDTSAVKDTAAKDGAPAPLPWSTVVVVPNEPSAAGAEAAPPPSKIRLAVYAADEEITDVLEKYARPPDVPVVVSPNVPAPVTGEPVTPKTLAPGTDSATLVTVPAPAGVAHVPSPRQNVEDEADVPLFKFVTGRFPVTSLASLTVSVLLAPAMVFPVSTCVAVVVTMVESAFGKV